MATIVTRSGKGAPLTHTELDTNFTGLNNEKAGYSVAGDGGTVTQATSKATGVTLDKRCGEIIMSGASLAASTTVSFVLTNNTIGSGDVLILNHSSVGTFGAYTLNGRCGAGSATIDVRNVTAGALTEAIVIRFAVVKARNS